MNLQPLLDSRIVPSCKNCRHKGSKLCHDYKKFKDYYERKHGYKKGNPNSHPKNYCKFWAYKPNGGVFETKTTVGCLISNQIVEFFRTGKFKK